MPILCWSVSLKLPYLAWQLQLRSSIVYVYGIPIISPITHVFLQEQESSLEIMGNTIPESFQSFIVPLNRAVLLDGITSDLLSLPRVRGSFRTFTWFLTALWSLFHKSIVKCKSSVCAKNIYSKYIFRKMTTIWIDGVTGSTVWWTWARTPFINQTVWILLYPWPSTGLNILLSPVDRYPRKISQVSLGKDWKNIYLWWHCRILTQGSTFSASISWLWVCELGKWMRNCDFLKLTSAYYSPALIFKNRFCCSTNQVTLWSLVLLFWH